MNLNKLLKSPVGMLDAELVNRDGEVMVEINFIKLKDGTMIYPKNAYIEIGDYFKPELLANIGEEDAE